MDRCVFCAIVAGNIPAQKVYEDDHVVAFHDINPVAPVHVLVIPKKHIASLMELSQEDEVLAGKILLAVQTVARELGLSEKGFRVVNNMGADGGQTVFHIHFHLLGGRTLTWPPG
jgi:histidine triad (HIT) family protein